MRCWGVRYRCKAHGKDLWAKQKSDKSTFYHRCYRSMMTGGWGVLFKEKNHHKTKKVEYKYDKEQVYLLETFD